MKVRGLKEKKASRREMGPAIAPNQERRSWKNLYSGIKRCFASYLKKGMIFKERLSTLILCCYINFSLGFLKYEIYFRMFLNQVINNCALESRLRKGNKKRTRKGFALIYSYRFFFSVR